MDKRSGKPETPDAVLSAYATLKGRYGFPISLKRINNHYYLYKQQIRWDRDSRKYVCVEMRYLGALADDGTFRPRKMVANDIDSAKAVIAAHGGKVTMPDPINLPAQQSAQRITDLDRRILTELTMDGRLQASEMARRLGAEERRVGYRIRSLEKRFNIVYKPKVKLESLGHLYFIVFVKFRASRPDPERLQKEMDSISAVQFAALTSGSRYDLVLILAASSDYRPGSTDGLPDIMMRIRMSPSLKEIASDWYVSFFDISKGLVPLRQSFVDEQLSKSVWTRRQERKTNSVSRNEYATLRALNADGAVAFREVESKNGMSEGSARYGYEGLMARKVLSNVTICMQGLRTKYNAFLIMEIIDEALYSDTRQEIFRIIINERADHISNRIALVANVGAPYGVLFLVPVANDGDLEALESEFYSKVKGIRLSSMVLTKTLCGTLPYNRFDNTKSGQYERLMLYERQHENK